MGQGQIKGLVTAVGSSPSAPEIAANTRAQSSTERARGPILSMLHDSAIQPWRLTRPKVGLNPVVPQRRHGDTMLPSVSEPNANPTRPPAAALADPADEPLEPTFGFQGLRVIPPNHLSPIASAPSVSF